MINWEKYFDKVYFISVAEQHERRSKKTEMLTALNLLNNDVFRIHYEVTNKFVDYFINCNSPYVLNLPKKSVLKTAYGHYVTIKEAYALGYNKILILEDDVSFLKDENVIINTFEQTPEDADIVMYSYEYNKDFNNGIELEDINIDLFNRFNSGFISGVCYMLSRDGMKMIIDIMEQFFISIDFCFSDNLIIYNNQEDKLNLPKLNKYFSKNIIAIQDNENGVKFPSNIKLADYWL